MDPHSHLPPPSTSTWCHLSLSHRTFPVAPSWVLIYWKLLESFLPSPARQAPPASLKSPLNSVVMQTVSPKRARARCRVRRGCASNAAITSGREGGWIIIKASPLPLMWTCLINTRLLGGDGGMDGWRMRGKRAALLIYPQTEHSVAGRGGDDTFLAMWCRSSSMWPFVLKHCIIMTTQLPTAAKCKSVWLTF